MTRTGIGCGSGRTRRREARPSFVPTLHSPIPPSSLIGTALVCRYSHMCSAPNSRRKPLIWCTGRGRPGSGASRNSNLGQLRRHDLVGIPRQLGDLVTSALVERNVARHERVRRQPESFDGGMRLLDGVKKGCANAMPMTGRLDADAANGADGPFNKVAVEGLGFGQLLPCIPAPRRRQPFGLPGARATKVRAALVVMRD